jgi:hypothetical protein
MFGPGDCPSFAMQLSIDFGRSPCSIAKRRAPNGLSHGSRIVYKGLRQRVDQVLGVNPSDTGDGFLVSFDGPARAGTCAPAIRDAATQLGINIRVGMCR